jgi:hypothetical protein
MTGLRQALAGYLELRRALGFKLERHAELLGQFVAWLEDHQAARSQPPMPWPGSPCPSVPARAG